MRTRSIAAVAAALSLALAACGGGDSGSSALSEDDFVDELADVCGDVERDLDKIDLPDDGDYENFAGDVLEVYNDALGRLGEIAPPEDLAGDFKDFVGNIEDQVDDIEKLGDASDEDEAGKYFERLSKLSDEQSDIAQDLDVEECDPNAGDDSDPTTTVAETTPPTPPPTPAPTAAPITLPSTVVPVTPAPTAPPTPATEAAPATNFTVVDLTTIFVAPDGFYLDPTTPTDATLELIASMPELNEKLLEIGVATLKDSDDDTAIADIWVGVSRTDSMPADWKTLDCPNDGTLRTSENGIPGIVCLGAADSPTWEIFTATVADVGISVYTLVSDIPGDLVADAFLAANP